MPHIMDDLTPEEVQRIQAIDEKYRPMLDKAREKSRKASDAYFNAGIKKSAAAPKNLSELGDLMTAATEEETALRCFSTAWR